MTATFRHLGPSELLPRYIFAENLLVRRRVLELGAVASTAGASAQFLIQRGARWVMACDEDPVAVEDAQRRLGTQQLRFRTTVFDDLEPHSFDLVLVADLGRYALAPKLLEEVARLVAKSGYLVGGLRNPAGLALAQLMDPDHADAPPTYGQLLDALTPHFASVEVATQSPVLGYQLAFERSDGLQVDGTLAGPGEAAYFVVIAGQEPFRSFEPTWVQLAPEPLAYTGNKLAEYAQRTRGWEERSQKLKDSLGKTREELEARSAEVHRLSGELERAKDDASRLVARVETMRSEPGVERDRDELTSRIRRAEAELQVARERALDTEKRLGKQREEVEGAQRASKQASAEVLAAQESVRLERARREEMAGLLEDTRVRLTSAYQELREATEQHAAAHVEREQARLVAERAEEKARALERELEVARQREVRLAEGQSTSLAAVEAVNAELARLKAEAQRLGDELTLKAAELARAQRVAESDAAVARQSRDHQEQARLQAERTSRERDAERVAYETELAAARGEAESLREQLARVTADQDQARTLAADLETRLASTREEYSGVGSRIGELEAELDVARARSQRLERDITTAVTAERSAREQAQVAQAQAEARVAELEADTEKLLGQVADLTAGMGDLTRARESDAALMEQTSSRAEGLAADLERARSELKTVRSELEEAVSRHDTDLEQALVAHAEEVEALRGERERAAAEEADQRAKAASALAQERDRVASLERELAEARTGAEAGTGRAAQLATALADAQARLTAISEELEQTRGELAAEREALEARVQAARTELESTRTDAAVVAERATERAERVQELEARIRELEERSEEQASEARERLGEVEAARDASREELQRLQEELAGQQQALDASRAELASVQETLRRDSDERVSKLDAELEKARAVRALAVERAEAAERELGALRVEREGFRDRIADAAEQLEQANTVGEERDRLRSELAGVKAGSERLRDELAAAAQQLETKVQELATLRDVRGDLDAELLRAKVRARELEDKVSSAQGAIHAAGTELPALREQLESVTAENRLFNEERERLVGEVERLERGRAELGASLEETQARTERERKRGVAEIESVRKELESARRELSAAQQLAREGQERAAKLDSLQRRLAAQESELQALRRAVSRQAPGGVQQIYERATAELSAVKEQLQTRRAAPPATSPRNVATPGKGVPPSTPSPVPPPPAVSPAAPPVTAKPAVAPDHEEEGIIIGVEITDEADEELPPGKS